MLLKLIWLSNPFTIESLLARATLNEMPKFFFTSDILLLFIFCAGIIQSQEDSSMKQFKRVEKTHCI